MSPKIQEEEDAPLWKSAIVHITDGGEVAAWFEDLVADGYVPSPVSAVTPLDASHVLLFAEMVDEDD